MKLNKSILIPALAITALLATTVTLAQSGGYRLPWLRMSSGGAVSSGGNYTLSGTLGQAEAGQVVGGGYTLTGGFWGAATVPNAPVFGGQIFVPIANLNPPTPVVAVTPTPVTPTVAEPPDCGDYEPNGELRNASSKPLLVFNAFCKGSLAGDKIGDDYFRLNKPPGTVVSAIVLQMLTGSAKPDLIEGAGKKYGAVELPFTLRVNYNYYVRVRNVTDAGDYRLRVNTR